MIQPRPLGLALRLLGPLVEGGCLVVLLRVRGQGQILFGVALESWLYVGLGLGLVMVIVGLLLSGTRRGRSDGGR